jgi:hypothetical protein
MGNTDMRAAFVTFLLVISFASVVTAALSQTLQPPRSQYSPLAAQQAKNPQHHSQTWYEFALSRINPGNFDYGAWMEERRAAFLAATARNRYFNYGLSATIVTLFLMAVCFKLWIDGKRKDWVTAEMMADLMNQDELSRDVARQAIR